MCADFVSMQADPQICWVAPRSEDADEGSMILGGQDVKPVEILESIDPHTVFILRYDRAGVKSLYWWVAQRLERADEGCMFFGGQDVASYCEKILSNFAGRVRYVHIWTAHWAANVCFYVKSVEEGWLLKIHHFEIFKSVELLWDQRVPMKRDRFCGDKTVCL